MLRSPAQLKERVQKLNLGLAMPQPNQVWPLAEPVLTPPATVDAPASIDCLVAGDGAGDALIFRRRPCRGREEPTAAGGGRSFTGRNQARTGSANASGIIFTTARDAVG